MTVHAPALHPSLPLERPLRGAALRLRRTVGALSLPATFLVMLVGSPLLDPLDDRANETATLQQAVGHADQIAGLAWAEVLTAVLTLAGLLTLVGAVRGRGAGWANATGVIAVLSSAGLVGIAMNHFVVSGLTASSLPMSERVEALQRFHHAGGPIVVLIMVSGLAFVTAAVAAWRAGLSSPLVLVPAAALLLLSTAPSEAAGYGGMVAGLVLGAWLARDLLRG
ncbi:MAG: hypothetical protein ACTHNS_05345 [Marmoricola sp.]